METSPELLIELGLVIFALGLLARLADRINLSPIPLYLLAGLAFGEGGAMPLVTTHSFIEVGAEIGVILLLLLLGLEYSAEQLVGNLKTNSKSGFVDFALNFTPGVAMGALLGWDAIACLVLGGITFVSSSGIIAKTLTDLGRTKYAETPVIISILVMEDLAMAVYLPIVTGLVVGGSIGAAAWPVAIALASVCVIMYVALRYGKQISALVASPNDEIFILLIFGLALTVAGFAEGVHVSAGVGAFLVGIALSDKVAVGAHAILTPLRDLFAAVFFVFFGLQTDPSSIGTVWMPAVGLALLTAGTKILTGWWAARNVADKKGRLRAGLALTARGEFSIVLAGIAVSAGLEADLGAFAATYVLILASTGPIMARFGGEKKEPAVI